LCVALRRGTVCHFGESVIRALAAARILLSTSIASPGAAHGGPVVSRRHADALAARGHEVCIAAPRGEPASGVAYETTIYGDSSRPRRHFEGQRPRHDDAGDIPELIRRFAPDVVYDVHGPAWAVEAAKAAGRPIVSMVGDYGWYCLQTFLVDSRLHRCSGPESAAKCFACLDRNYPIRWRAVHAALRPAARAGLARFPLLDGVTDALDYLPRMRAVVDRFVVGDAQAREFFTANGVAADRLVEIPQALPAAALVRRPHASGVPVRDRPLRLCFVGRPHADKGIHVLAAAFDALPRDLPVELALVHSQLATAANLRPRFPSARRFDADVARGRIRLVQPATHDDVFAEMARADVGVVPSIAYESPSLAMLEFVAQGTPVVRSESRGMDHVIADGVNGRTFPYGNAQALAAVLRDLATDPSPLERWRAALPPVASDDQYAARLAQVFDSVRFKPV
jgi:glycosyltransferase involved in cell wall biosynthesis